MSDPINVPLLDLKPQYKALKTEIDAAVQAVVDSQYFILGPTVSEFEAKCQQYCEAEHVIGCGSGSDALLLALMALVPGLPKVEGQVICPSLLLLRHRRSDLPGRTDTRLLRHRPRHLQHVPRACGHPGRTVRQSRGHHAGPSLRTGRRHGCLPRAR